MEQSQEFEENNKEIKEASYPVGGFYNEEALHREALSHLNDHLNDPNNHAHLSAAVNKLQLASQHGNSLSERLLPFVKDHQTGFSQSHESIGGLCAIHFSTGCYSDGYKLLLALLTQNYPNMCSLINHILAEKSRRTFVFKKFKTVRQDYPFMGNELPQMIQTFLDTFIISDINRYCAIKLASHTQADLGKIYIDESLIIPESNNSTIFVPKLLGVGVDIINRKKSYFDTGVKYCIYAAKQNDQDAYETLAKALRETGDYEAFFEQLFPSFKSGDEQTQDLFNRIIFQDNRTFVGFRNYTKRLRAEKENSPVSKALYDENMIDSIMNNYELYVESQEPADTRPSIVSLSSFAKDLMDKTTKQSVHGGDTPKTLEEARISSEEEKEQKEYDDAMKLFYTKPRDSLMLLLDVSEPRRNLKAYEKLNLIRLSDGYTNPQIAQENDYGRLLKECEKKKAKEWFDSFEKLFAKKTKNYNFTDQEIRVAAVDLEKAYRYENLAAIEYVKKLKKLNCYKNPQTATAKTPRDWLAIQFVDLSAMSAAVNGTHTEKPSKQEPMVRLSSQKTKTKKTNNTNHNAMVDTAGDIPKISSPVSVSPVISSFKENNPREQKSKSSTNTNTSTLSSHTEKVVEKKPIDKKYAEQQFIRGLTYTLQGTDEGYNEAFNFFQNAAAHGHVQAKYNVGMMYLEGRGVKANVTEAIRYLEYSADKKHAGASSKLGIIYQYGLGVKPDIDKAFIYFQAAALEGDPEGQYYLGAIYDTGEVIERNFPKAQQLYLQSSYQGFDAFKAHKKVKKLERFYQEKNTQSTPLKDETTRKGRTEILSDPGQQIQLLSPSVSTPVAEFFPKIDEKQKDTIQSDTTLPPGKRGHKERDKKKDVELTPTLMVTNDQLLTESKEEAVVPSESKIKHPSERRVHSKKALMEIQPKPSRRRLERHSSSSKSIEDVPVIKENSVSDHSTSTEAASTKPKERKSIHRTQSLISIPSAKTPHRKKEPTLQETLNNESKPRKTIHRTLSLNNVSLGIDSEESSVKKEKDKKKNKSPITKTSLKDHLSPKKKLERRDSEKKLALSVSEEASDYSSSEISTSDKPLVDLFKQDGKRDENLKNLKKLFNNRDLVKASDIKLNRSIVVRALRELGPKGKKIITWNFETPGNKNTSIIRADIIRTSEHSKTQELPTLNIHLHSRQGKWYEDANIKDHFIKFICACDPSVKVLVAGIQKNNTNS